MNFTINLFVFFIWLILLFVAGYFARGYYDTQLYDLAAEAAAVPSYLVSDGRIFRVDPIDGILTPCVTVDADGNRAPITAGTTGLRLRCAGR